jgi:hypothetical protein
VKPLKAASRVAITLVLLVVAALALLRWTSGGLPVPTGEAEETPISVTLPEGYPTPHEFRNGQEVADYVVALLELPPDLVSTVAARAYPRDILVMKGGPGARIVTPNPTIETDPVRRATPELGDPVWIVGLMTPTGMPTWKLDEVMQMPPRPTGSPDNLTVEFYVVVDDIGNLIESGTLDASSDGVVRHGAPWQLQDIAKLPTVAP